MPANATNQPAQATGSAGLTGAASGRPGRPDNQVRPVRDGVGLGVAVGISGVAFGAAAVSSGLTAWQACALSLLAFTGASQFALVGVIASGGSLLAGTAGAVLLGGRNTLYGLRLADVLRPRGPRRPLTALGVIDETTAVALAQPCPEAARKGFTATFTAIYLTWNLSTLAGAVGAGRVGSPQSFGLDVVGPAAFLALIWPRLRAGSTERWVAAAGAAIAVGTTAVLPVGVPVILAATAALAAALMSVGGPRSDAGRLGSDRSGMRTSAEPGTNRDPRANPEPGTNREPGGR